MEKHQRDNNKPYRNKHGSGWKRLTRITNNCPNSLPPPPPHPFIRLPRRLTNNETEKFRLNFSNCLTLTQLLRKIITILRIDRMLVKPFSYFTSHHLITRTNHVSHMHYHFHIQPRVKQLSFMQSAQPPLHTSSLISAARTEYPDVSAARQEDNPKQTADGSGEAVVMTSSLDRRKREALLTNWRKETTPAQHLTCIIMK